MTKLRLIVPFACLFAITCSHAPTSTPELQAILSSETPPRGISSDVWEDTRTFYAAREQTLVWTSARGPTPTTTAALEALSLAHAHGLDPDDYGGGDVRTRATALETDDDAVKRAQIIADLDVRLTAGLLHLGRHVATGRLQPKTIDPRWNTRREPPDYAAALQRAAESDIRSFLDGLQPTHPEYAKLRSALASLRDQAKAGWPKVPRARVKIGQWNATAVAPLRQRLAAGGYLPQGTALDSQHYDEVVEKAVKAFQHHHGLPASGVLDLPTVEKMNVHVDARIAQVAMNLERWRWLPDQLGTRHFVVNVPQFHLFARENGRTVLDMRVVVGKRGNETPLFSDQMETVVFSPYWNIPETIAIEETLPAMTSDPEFLARNNMEVVNTAGEVVSPDEIPWGDESALKHYRFRQRPGATNALGYVKFLFPNKHAVYLHDTPADALFKRIGRAFSHGCVRVEEPERLAQYVLRDQPQWTSDAIHTAMRSGDERHVNLAEKIPVYIAYFTSWVDEQGGLHFADDVYGYDARQARANGVGRSAQTASRRAYR